MELNLTRSMLARWSRFGLTVGLSMTVLDFFVFFGIPPIREPVRAWLGRLMEPLLLGVPAGIGAASLLAWTVSFFWRDTAEAPHESGGGGGQPPPPTLP